MRAVVQRVTTSSVSVDGEVVGKIGKGLNVLVGVGEGDTEADCEYMANKITGLRIFDDGEGKMNLSLLDLMDKNIEVGMLIISQFTLYGDCRKGKRPSYTRAEEPQRANYLHEYFVNLCKDKGIHEETGIFQANMQVEIHNDGPVTLLVDSKKEF